MRSFVSKCPILLIAVLCISASAQEKPKPCVCACGGQISCPADTTAYCECSKSDNCSGECLRQQPTPKRQAAVVLTRITRERITEQRLQEEPKKYSSILGNLFEGKVGAGIYKIEYETRTIQFSFTTKALDLLYQAKKMLDEGLR